MIQFRESAKIRDEKEKFLHKEKTALDKLQKLTAEKERNYDQIIKQVDAEKDQLKTMHKFIDFVEEQASPKQRSISPLGLSHHQGNTIAHGPPSGIPVRLHHRTTKGHTSKMDASYRNPYTNLAALPTIKSHGLNSMAGS
jgi:hypothetical protein